ncbi:hypothetical protein FXB39_15150 [Nocardioides sp. BGMRC 2183]|nr:hypothetical protein FXB39_15150 [Nocardioides sp. BGMRC 2183]
MIDATTFRDVMSQWPSGVTVVTTLGADGSRHGMTASSFSSVSLDPPLVSICLTKTLYTHRLIRDSGVFGISVLAKDQAEVGRRFAGMEKDVASRFSGESWTTGETGVALLDSALGWFDCRLLHEYPGGDHTIFVGEVVAGRAARRSAPLLFHSRGWGQFADVLPDVATLSDGGVVGALVDAGRSEEVVEVTAGVAAAGSRVRIADLSRVRSAEEARGLVGSWAPLDAASVLVSDRRQADLALALGVGTVELVVDPGRRDQVDAALVAVDGIAARTAVHLISAFGVERLDVVLEAVQRLARAGVAEIVLPDTAGSATPLRVRALLQEAVAIARPVPLRVGLHDRDRLGLVKAIIALKSGVRHFDTTLAGLDGSVATEDLIRLLEEVDVDTPVDPGLLIELARGVRRPERDGHSTTLTTLAKNGAALIDAGGPETVGAAG